MRILLYENPEEHISPTGKIRSIENDIEETVKLLGFEYAGITKNVWHADQQLQKKDIELVIIHHHNFRDIDYLKQRHPKVKFAASSSFITERSDYNKILLQHYDYLMCKWYDEDLKKITENMSGETR